MHSGPNEIPHIALCSRCGHEMGTYLADPGELCIECTTHDEDGEETKLVCTNGHEHCGYGPFLGCPYCETRPKRERDPDDLLQEARDDVDEQQEWHDFDPDC